MWNQFMRPRVLCDTCFVVTCFVVTCLILSMKKLYSNNRSFRFRHFRTENSIASKGLRRLCFYTCLSFCPQGESASVHAWIPPSPGADTTVRDQAPPGADTPGRRHPPRSACWEIRPTSGRYASYWNAIVSLIIFSGYLFHVDAEPI